MNKNDTLKTDITTSQDLSAGAGTALDFTTTVARKWRLISVTIKASENITETITLTKDSKQGVAYDTILRSLSLVAQQNFLYKPEGGEDFQSGDELRVQCTAANNTGTVYVTIKCRELE